MDIFVLDENLDTIRVLDIYSSIIWTDRYQEYGDFELTKSIEIEDFSYLKHGYYLWCKKSEHLMIIEEVKIDANYDEDNRLIVSGRSLESILTRRIVWGLKNLNGNFQEQIETLFNENIISPSKPERKIDNFIFKKTSDPFISKLTIETQYTGDNIYTIINNACVEYGIGFKITMNHDKQMVFEFYYGTDRSHDQTENSYVVFSYNFDNLVNSNYLDSKISLKNVTLVGGEGEGIKRRYTAVGDISGIERRELFTDARDISSEINENIYETITFDRRSQVFDETTKRFVTNNLFDSCILDLTKYPERTISLTIPTFNNHEGEKSNYSTIVVDHSGNYISTIKIWDMYKDEESAEPMINKGSIETFEYLLPKDVNYIYTSMYNSKAISEGVYYGEISDFECKSIKLSNDEYIAQLKQRGKEKLSENKDVISFEGEAEPNAMFKYGKDYFIGDVVQIIDSYGHNVKSRILELIISENEEGLLIYPTFSSIKEEGE